MHPTLDHLNTPTYEGSDTMQVQFYDSQNNVPSVHAVNVVTDYSGWPWLCGTAMLLTVFGDRLYFGEVWTIPVG